jgi:hypothetical protein
MVESVSTLDIFYPPMIPTTPPKAPKTVTIVLSSLSPALHLEG